MPLDKQGHEVPDPTPVAVPAHFKRPPTLAEQVQRLVRRYSEEQAEKDGFETLEESEDFDIGDDPEDPGTIFETFFDPVLGKDITLQEYKEREPLYRERYLRAHQQQLEQEEKFEAVKEAVDVARKRGRSEAKSQANQEPRAATSGEPEGRDPGPGKQKA